MWKRVGEVFAGDRADSPCHDLASCDTHFLQMCSSLVILAHAHISFGFPTLIYWLLEVHARHKYIEEKNRARNHPPIHLNTFLKPEVITNVGKLSLAVQ